MRILLLLSPSARTRPVPKSETIAMTVRASAEAVRTSGNSVLPVDQRAFLPHRLRGIEPVMSALSGTHRNGMRGAGAGAKAESELSDGVGRRGTGSGIAAIGIAAIRIGAGSTAKPAAAVAFSHMCA